MEEEEKKFVTEIEKFNISLGLPFMDLELVQKIYHNECLRRFIAKIMQSFWDKKKMDQLKVAQILQQLRKGASMNKIPELRNAARKRMLEAEIATRKEEYRRKEGVLTGLIKHMKEAKGALAERATAVEAMQRRRAASVLQRCALEALRAQAVELEERTGLLARDAELRRGPADPAKAASAQEVLEVVQAAADAHQTQTEESQDAADQVAGLWEATEPLVEAFSWRQLHQAALEAQAGFNGVADALSPADSGSDGEGAAASVDGDGDSVGATAHTLNETYVAQGAAGDGSPAEAALGRLHCAVRAASARLCLLNLRNCEKRLQLNRLLEAKANTLSGAALREEECLRMRKACRRAFERGERRALQQRLLGLRAEAEALAEAQHCLDAAREAERSLRQQLVDHARDTRLLLADLQLQPEQLSRYRTRLAEWRRGHAGASRRVEAASDSLARLVLSGPRELQLFLQLPPGALKQPGRRPAMDTAAFPPALRQQLPAAPPFALILRLVESTALVRAAERMVSALPAPAPPATVAPAAPCGPAQSARLIRHPPEASHPASGHNSRRMTLPASLSVPPAAAAAEGPPTTLALLAAAQSRALRAEQSLQKWDVRMEGAVVPSVVDTLSKLQALLDFMWQQPLLGVVCGPEKGRRVEQLLLRTEAACVKCVDALEDAATPGAAGSG